MKPIRRKPEVTSARPIRNEKPCRIRQYSDEMNCSTCSLTWDVNDSHPPRCLLDID